MQEAEKMLNGKTILITGGTGSFGNAFTEYVLTHYDPKKIIIYLSLIHISEPTRH